MFKRKSNLPPRPKLPTVNQIIEDLTSTKHEDPLFVAARNISHKGFKMDDTQEQDASYQDIKKFLELNQGLQDVMKTLKSINENLNEEEKEISDSFDKLKEKASNVPA